MPDDRPDYSLEKYLGLLGVAAVALGGDATGSSDDKKNEDLRAAIPKPEKPEISLVRHFQVGEANYMKPPMAEQLIEPDGTSLSGSGRVAVCTCNTVCTCVPVSICSCNTVCTCNTVNRSYGVSRSGGGSRGGGGGGGGIYRTYWVPCF